jgi:hypothetical protein
MDSNMGRASITLSLQYGRRGSATVNSASVLLSNQPDAAGIKGKRRYVLKPRLSLSLPCGRSSVGLARV